MRTITIIYDLIETNLQYTNTLSLQQIDKYSTKNTLTKTIFFYCLLLLIHLKKELYFDDKEVISGKIRDRQEISKVFKSYKKLINKQNETLIFITCKRKK